jgi:predicted Fe-S protein YdhL (DUF1289 family)
MLISTFVERLSVVRAGLTRAAKWGKLAQTTGEHAMAKFPKIDSPCPYKADLAAIMDGDFCRMCKREVFDLSGWSDGERVAFLKGCETEVCVRYTLPVRPALAAAALAAAVVGLPAAAQDVAPTPIEVATPDEDYDMIIVGGIKDPKAVAMVEDPADANLPESPVVYDDAPQPVTVKPAS